MLLQFRKRTDIIADIRDEVDAVLARVSEPMSPDLSARDRGAALVPGAEEFEVQHWTLSSKPGEALEESVVKVP